MAQEEKILCDLLEGISDEVAADAKISKCAAIAIVGGVLLDEGMIQHLNISRKVQYEIKKHIAARCIGDTDIIFEGLQE